MLGFLKKRRWERWRAQPFPSEFIPILTSNVPVYKRLPDDLRTQLHGHINVLLADKHYEGCNGLEMTDEVRVTIAGEAALLILNRETKYYPELLTILVYPDVFYADIEDNEGHIVSEYKEDRSGESWDMGVIILSWEDAVKHASTGRGGYNVVLHEFAHQLDMENGAMDGIPKLSTHAERAEWVRVFTQAYEDFERGGKRNSVVDEYASGDPSEFFAVVTESFFERSIAFKREQPVLYDVLSRYYCVDPATWSAPAAAVREALPRAGRRARRPQRKPR